MNATPQGSSKRPSVLVVDDDRGVREAVRISLQDTGFDVTDAEDGETALALVETVRPALILLDILLPHIDGYATCQELRRSPATEHTPIVIMTGLDDTDSINHAYDVGATDFVTKPVNYLILGYRMRYVLRAKETADRLRHTADELRRSEARLSTAQQIAKIGYWEWDASAAESHRCGGIAEILGDVEVDPFRDLEGFLALVHPADRPRVERTFRSALNRRQTYAFEHRVLKPNGSLAVVHQEGGVTARDASEAARFVGTIQDITERRRAEERIRHLAYYDELTGLPNRLMFLEQLEEALTVAKRHDRCLVLLLLDLDNFKRFNETLGHEIGDKILQQAAGRLRSCLSRTASQFRDPTDRPLTLQGSKGNNTAAHLGGDEFVVTLTEIERIEDASITARRVAAEMRRPIVVQDETVHLTVSIGISGFPVDGDDANTLLKHAEVAMNYAKERGRDRHQFFRESLNTQTVRKYSLETELRKAIENDQIELYYQPRVHLPSGQAVGMEALIRWHHPALGVVSPLEFIPIAEETGLIQPLGEWTLHAACAQTKAWQEEGLRGLTVSVNLSPAQFKQNRLKHQVETMLKQTGLESRFLELELTENLLLEDSDSRIGVLQQLNDTGVGLAIDDFGTGYSSLSYLQRLPISALKIDQCFVRNLNTVKDDASIVSAIITLGHSLCLKVVAEGVEEQEHLDVLRSNRCDEVQGFYYSPALPSRDFADWINAQSAEKPVASGLRAPTAPYSKDFTFAKVRH